MSVAYCPFDRTQLLNDFQAIYMKGWFESQWEYHWRECGGRYFLFCPLCHRSFTLRANQLSERVQTRIERN